MTDSPFEVALRATLKAAAPLEVPGRLENRARDIPTGTRLNHRWGWPGASRTRNLAIAAAALVVTVVLLVSFGLPSRRAHSGGVSVSPGSDASILPGPSVSPAASPSASLAASSLLDVGLVRTFFPEPNGVVCTCPDFRTYVGRLTRPDGRAVSTWNLRQLPGSDPVAAGTYSFEAYSLLVSDSAETGVRSSSAPIAQCSTPVTLDAGSITTLSVTFDYMNNTCVFGTPAISESPDASSIAFSCPQDPVHPGRPGSPAFLPSSFCPAEEVAVETAVAKLAYPHPIRSITIVNGILGCPFQTGSESCPGLPGTRAYAAFVGSDAVVALKVGLVANGPVVASVEAFQVPPPGWTMP
jgi:hypothetical protein